MTTFNPDHLSHYLVIGPENTGDRSPLKTIQDAVQAGMTMIQIRAKETDAKDIIHLVSQVADMLEMQNKSDQVTLLVNDRLDVVLACRELGIKVDGIHVGQSDIPVDVCRKYLGEDSVIGLSASTAKLIEYVKQADTSPIDYFGAGPLHPTDTKPEAGYYDGPDGEITLRTFDELKELADVSPIPVVVGGGVQAEDLTELKKTGVAGYFVISAVAHEKDPYQAAKTLVDTWEETEI